MPTAHDITQMLQRWSEGDREAFDELVQILYEELKRRAHLQLHREGPCRSMNTTGLVHEAYLRLAHIERMRWKDRNHFLAMAARAMRRVLVDDARERSALKRGGGHQRVNKETPGLVPDSRIEVLVDLDRALDQLEEEYPRPCKAVELHYFGGLTQEDVGAVLGISQPTVMRDLRFARAWLASRLDRDVGW